MTHRLLSPLVSSTAGPVIRRSFLWVLVLTCLVLRGDAWAGGALQPLTIVSDGKAYRFKVELAADPESRRTGLMYRESLAPDQGMLFDYGEPQFAAMWMKNTLISLDMFFIAADGGIIRIARRAVPKSLTVIPSGGPITGVLELLGGTADRLGLKAGDKVVHGIFGGG